MNSGLSHHDILPLKELRISIEEPKLSFQDILANFSSADIRVLSLHGIFSKDHFPSTSAVLVIVAECFPSLEELVLRGSRDYECDYVRSMASAETCPDRLRHRFQYRKAPTDFD